MNRPPAASLRPALPADVPVLAAMVRASILELTGEDYDEDQQEAWAAAAGDEAALADRITGQLAIIATRGSEPVGLIVLTDNKLVDLLFVHPEAAGSGVGALLCDAIERLAAGRGAKNLTVDASDTALGFFQKRGYVARQRNTVPRGAVWLGNTTLEKTLDAPATTH